MFALFFSLYYSMFKGSWSLYAWNDLWLSGGAINNSIKQAFNSIGQLLTTMFNNTTTAYTNLGTEVFANGNFMVIVALVLALITSIGIVVMAVKGVKRAFGIFFMGIRR